jgi:hypothetical protein
MKRKYCIKALLAGCFVLAALSGVAENYITKQEIKVRSGAGNTYAIEGIIPADSMIDVQEINGNWATIQYNNQAGYISVKFISKPLAVGQNVAASENKSGSHPSATFYIIGGIVLLLVIRFFTVRISELLGLSSEEAFKYRCRNCGRYSTRRGHVYKCNDGAHDWFKS